ncbi:MAG: SDR family NAD(P)-dependent oxidoreductase [Hyphomicrobiaceae bacterium]
MADGYILITGASRGIGAAIASELAGRGFRVAGLTRSGKSAAGEGFVCDVSDEASIKAAVAAVAAKGPIAGLVNNAGLYEEADSATLSAADFDKLMHNNATSAFVAAREVYPQLKRAGGGLIVNIGSFYDRLGVPRSLAYCASKAAVAAITRCLAVEWASDKVRVLNVAPGFIATDLNKEYLKNDGFRRWLEKRVPVGRAGEPEEVARLVVSLFTTDIGFLTGVTIYADGAQSIVQ